MGLWSIITGAGSAKTVIDTGMELAKKGASGIDKMFYTEEEKSDSTALETKVNMEQSLEFAKLAIAESGASAVTRRIALLIILLLFSIFTITALVFLCLGNAPLVGSIIALANALDIGYLTMIVTVSTFGYYSISKRKK